MSLVCHPGSVQEDKPQPNPYLELEGPDVDRDDLVGVKTFTLPVSGSVVVFGPEIDVIRTPEFQRLAGIKQLGTSYVVFRGALHTRFEHSLGSLHQAELILRAIENNPIDSKHISPQARRLARLGALLHDLPHVPFGHTLEDELHLLKRHDKNEFRISRFFKRGNIRRLLESTLGVDEFEILLEILSADRDEDFAAVGEYAFVADIVGNTVCAGLLDYVQRDCLTCGLPAAVGERFLDYLSITGDDESRPIDRRRLVLNLGKKRMPRPDVESEVVKLLGYRYELAERVYFHHAKNSASVMIGRAVQESAWATGEDSPRALDRNFYWLSDDLMLNALAEPDIEAALSIQHDPAVVADRRLASELARMVLVRDLYKIAFLGVSDDIPFGIQRIHEDYGQWPERRRQLEDRFADQAGVRRGRVLLHVPRQRMMMKDADVRVRTDTGEIVKLREWDRRHSRRIEALNDAHERLWRVLVYVHPAEIDKVEVVRAAAEDEFRTVSRYVPLPKIGRYERTLFDHLSEEWVLTPGDAKALESAAYVPSESDRRSATERRILSAIRRKRRDDNGPSLERR